MGTTNRHNDTVQTPKMATAGTRWAAAPTLLMALANTAAGPSADGSDLPKAVAWVASLIGLAGIIAAVASSGASAGDAQAVIVIGVIKAAGGVVALLQHWSGGVIGIVLGVAAVVLAFMPARRFQANNPVLVP